MTKTDLTPGSTSSGGNNADEQLWQWTATKMASAVATGLVSSREIVTSCLERIDEVNPHLNALVEVRPDEALSLADDADRRRAGPRMKKPRPGGRGRSRSRWGSCCLRRRCSSWAPSRGVIR